MFQHPFFKIPGMILEGWQVIPGPDGIQHMVIAGYGKLQADGQRMFVVASEVTLNFENYAQILAERQGEMKSERLQLDSYGIAFQAKYGAPFFDASIPPVEQVAPHFKVVSGGLEIGATCQAAIWQDRRMSHQLGFRFRHVLPRVDPDRLAKLKGITLNVQLELPDSGSAEPPDFDGLTERLIEDIAEYNSGLQGRKATSQLVPGTESKGEAWTLMGLLGPQPLEDHVFVQNFGFDIQVAMMPNIVTYSEACAQLQSLVDRSDQPGTDVLIASYSVPDQKGVMYPAERLAYILLAEKPPTVYAKHIGQVVCHMHASPESFETNVIPRSS